VTIVLVHGGGFDHRCWDPMLPFLDPSVVAVDLPGRGVRPADLGALDIGDFVAAVVEDIEAKGLENVLLIGHSMAGITLPGVAERIPHRLRRMVFVSCTVPPEGLSILDTLEPEVRRLAEGQEGSTQRVLDASTARVMFCNDMNERLTKYTLSLMVPEAPNVLAEQVSHAGLRVGVPTAWVKLLRDVVVAPDKQDGSIATVAAADIVELDAGHMAMISQPAELAALLTKL
jgi:pimeloyl-ACP methyl ester carboxylesterase